jgi:rhodanese-related sulfurtransferase/DNA-binding transcriptional ArsR family regulator
MSSGNFKHALFNQFARVGKALANGNRLELLELLAQGERSVDELAKVSGLSVANTSQHLQLLRQSGLVSSRKEGLKVFYRISNDEVIELLINLRHIAERELADVSLLLNTFLTGKDKLEPIAREELLERVNNNLVTVIDVRPVEEFNAGHVPGAINVPLVDLHKHLDKLGNKKEIVAYCRGPHCVLAFDAVSELRKKGLAARRMEDGFPEWKHSGMPVEN